MPSNLTQTLTPFDMQLSRVFVRSGDEVRQGQALVQFDTKDLELERSRLRSLIDQSSVDVRAALLEGDAAAASIARADVNANQAKLDAVLRKIGMSTITAPQDGMVIEADIEQKIGQVLPQGTKVLSFAPMDQFELEIHIPEHNARHISVDQQGAFASSADPGHDMEYTIESISGAAELIDGKNVFVARAKLNDSSEYLRQGMEGYAKTRVGWRPIPWLVFHRIYEYAASHFWL